MNQSEFKTNTCKRRQARENTCERDTTAFGPGFPLVEKMARTLPTSHTERSGITIDTQLKTALIRYSK